MTDNNNQNEHSEDINTWEEVILTYTAALKQIETKLDVLESEFQHVHNYNPIEHVKTRIKTPESIVKKLKKNGYEATIENMITYVNDIAGIRIICSFTNDIYKVVEMIKRQKDIKILYVKDYITFPKPSGYRSYHLIVSVPVYLSERVVSVKVEIQIRTVAQDFWASLEHKMNYKLDKNAPEKIKHELYECAQMVSLLDDKMLRLNEEIQEEVEKQQKSKE